MKILITGATGDVGSRKAEELIGRGERPRLFVRDPGKAAERFGDRADLCVGDLDSADVLFAAMRGLDSLFLVNIGPSIPQRDALATRAASAAGIRHIVKLSSMDVQHGLALGVWHEKGEAAIRTAGIPFTFLQPSGFMSNLLAWTHSVRHEAVLRSATGEGRRAFIHSADIAAVAVEVLATRSCIGESLVLTGPEALTFAQIADTLSAAIGKPLRHETISDEEARQRYAATGAASYDVDAHVALWRAIRENRLGAVTPTVEKLLRRLPIRFGQWAQENAAAFQ